MPRVSFKTKNGRYVSFTARSGRRTTYRVRRRRTVYRTRRIRQRVIYRTKPIHKKRNAGKFFRTHILPPHKFWVSESIIGEKRMMYLHHERRKPYPTAIGPFDTEGEARRAYRKHFG